MRYGMRWALVVALSVLAFAAVFLLFYAVDVPLLPTSDEGRVAVGVAAATVAATVGGTWGASWVQRAAQAVTAPAGPTGGMRLELPNAMVTVNGTSADEPPHLLVRMGDLPREPVGFQPREDLLAELADATERHSLTVVHAVTGARGVGKTQLAAAYARRRIEEGWPVVAWITAENSGQLMSGLAELADQLGVREAGDDAAKAARAALTWIGRNPDPCLLVLDNATDPDEVAGWLPTAGRAQVVVTATSRDFTNLAGARVDVTVFTEEEALDFLRRRTGVASDDGAREVAAELGRLPLALAQAAHVIRVRGTGYRGYLERLRAYPLRTALEKVPGERYPHRVAEAMLIAAEQVEQRGPDGAVRVLLEVLSVLSPAGVPRRLLHGVVRQAGVHDADVVEAALGVVTQASLATDSGADAVNLHRLVQRVIRERAGERIRDVVRAAVRHLEAVLIPPGEAWERREFGGQLVDQIDALWGVVREDLPSYEEADQESLVRLRRWAAYDHLGHVGAMGRAVVRAGGTRRDCEAALGEEAAATLSALELEGDMCAWAGRTEQAIGARARRLEITERCLSPEDERTLTARRDLARSYETAGRYELSVPMYEALERDMRRLHGADHVETRGALSDLARTYAAAGRLREAARIVDRMRPDWSQGPAPSAASLYSLQSLAETYGSVGRDEEGVALLRRYVVACEDEHGPEHAETVWARNNLALQCLDAALYDEARAAAERALADAERIFGPESEETVTIRDTLATCLIRAERDEEALALFRRVVDERTALHGREHPVVLRARGSLVWGLDQSKRHGDAYAAQVQLIADHERLLGRDHPSTFGVRSFHIHLCTRHGRIQEAIDFAREVLADHERVHGRLHPHTFDVCLGLADALTSAAHYSEALALLRQTLRNTRRSLGAGHRLTFSARAGLARVLRLSGEVDEARGLREENVAEYARLFGDDHIEVVWARSDLADLLTWHGLHDEALALHRGVVDDVTRIWGADHPSTLAARRWLAVACGNAGRHRERLRLTGEALADCERMLGADALPTLATLGEQVIALRMAGQRREARRLDRELYADYARVLGVDHPITIDKYDDVADGYRAVQRRVKALRIRERVLHACEARSGPWSWESVHARRRLSGAYASVGLLWRDAAWQRRFLDDLTAHFGPDHPATRRQREWWCHALLRTGRWRQAKEAADTHRADCERLYGPDHMWTLDARWLVAHTARRTGRVRTALALYADLVADRARVHGPDHPRTWWARLNHAYATFWALHPHRAVVLFETVIDDGRRIFGSDSSQVEDRVRWRYPFLCLITGHWLRMVAALRLRRHPVV
ncbi:FxSxx-COOH system tetratricopeptide repeat protein [Streptomyces sp. DSM 40750]|uniref:FxSxx-COOH system tetratricopeptide repeat protein n=1 Tax=Streptomyces sp. DSM 40750 TaxID=2801030 RepID=UPI00214BC45F|nr:FxSxx-COOH system tetratricopeptide repeat protein [Streptomyces sp. DSM 40750]UUU22029.1 FxSxx-COOH system tetratricopeptide repeat protein [Streptomyces sp. DSM 40750]